MTTTGLNLFTAATVASLCLLATATPAAGQHALRPNMEAAHARPSVPAAQRREAKSPETERAEQLKSFRGIAAKLNMTPEALQSAYEAAKQADPKLTRGQFIAANVLAQNRSSKDPNITTQGILDGLQSGKSIGQTLQSLGLSKSAAKEAEHAAAREVIEAQVGTTEASETKPDQDKPNNP